jgi:hypothetical protein
MASLIQGLQQLNSMAHIRLLKTIQNYPNAEDLEAATGVDIPVPGSTKHVQHKHLFKCTF